MFSGDEDEWKVTQAL